MPYNTLRFSHEAARSITCNARGRYTCNENALSAPNNGEPGVGPPLVCQICCEEDDLDLPIAWATAAHDLESNRYRAASLRDLVAVAERYRARTPGGSWQATQTQLENIFGSRRRMYVYRMVVAAQTLSKPVLDRLAESSLSPSHVHENKFFLGSGCHAQSRLSDEAKLAVIDVAQGDLESGRSISASTFATEYCAPMRHGEVWVSAKRREYGKLCEIPAFRRVATFLLSSKARVPILQCMRASVRLEGTSKEQPGIEVRRATRSEEQK